MAQYPVDDTAGIIEGVNYLLSGPTGLGQNFDGFISYSPAYITSYFRAPFSLEKSIANAARTKWYSDPVSIGSIAGIDDYTFEVTFLSAQPTPPFSIGQALEISGTTASGSDSNFYNTYWRAPGVVTCSTTSVVIQTTKTYDWPSATGGQIRLNAADDYVSTDANGRVSVYGASDKVFVSGQINLDFDYTSTAAGSMDLYVAINRYIGFVDTKDPNNKDYLFLLDKTIAEQVHTITIPGSATVASPATITGQEFVFTTMIDSPTYTTSRNGQTITQGYGFYWYILELYFDSNNLSGAIVNPVQVTTNLRSLTAQVIKQ